MLPCSNCGVVFYLVTNHFYNMHQKILFFMLLTLFCGLISCHSAQQEAEGKLFAGKSLTKGQTKLLSMISGQKCQVSTDTHAPKQRVSDSIWTDPCRLSEEKYTATSGNEYEKGYILESLRCTALKGPWIATFVEYEQKGKNISVPALLRPQTAYSPKKLYKHLTRLNIYLSYDSTDPIILLVELDEGAPVSGDLDTGM